MPKSSSGFPPPACRPVCLFGALPLLVLTSVGCSVLFPEAPPASAPSAIPPAPASESPAAGETASNRHVGDFFVHMISGSFRKQPALLTERVVAHENDAWIIEYTLEDSTGSRGIRTWLDENGEIARVTRVSGGAEENGTLADYDALMAATSVVPDENDGLAATTRGTCTVGPAELDCETKSYRVRLGDKEASLGITASAALPGRDLAGEITAADGTVIFRSELLQHGSGAPSQDRPFALLSDP